MSFGSLCINGLVQDSSNSIASALELLRSCTKPLIWSLISMTPDEFSLLRMIQRLCGLNEKYEICVTEVNSINFQNTIR